ncbi:hypothetical protein N2152v2_006672 [Parachlorella kessleri]
MSSFWLGNLLAPAAGSISDHHLLLGTLQLKLKGRCRQQRQPRLAVELLQNPRNPAAAQYTVLLDTHILQLQRQQQQQQPQRFGTPKTPTMPSCLPSPPPAPRKPVPTTPVHIHPSHQPSLPSPPVPCAPGKPRVLIASSPQPPSPQLRAPSPSPSPPAPLSLGQLTAAVGKAAAAALPPAATCAKQPWVDDEVLHLSAARQAARKAGDKQLAQQLKVRIQRHTYKTRRAYFFRVGCQMQQAYRSKHQGELWRCQREVVGGSQPQRKLQLKDDAGKPLSLRQQDAAIVAHFQQALNPSSSVSAAVLAEVYCPPCTGEWPQPTQEEFQQALQRLKFGKAADAQGLRAEHLRTAGPMFQAALYQLVCQVWQDAATPAPAELTEADLLALVKPKGDTSQLKVLRGISIISLVRKRGCADHISTVRRLEELALEWKQPMHSCAVDLKAAFDSASRDALWVLLRAQGLPEPAIQLLQRLYSNTTCRLRQAPGQHSASFTVSVGVQQGAPDSCPLFNVLMDRILTETLAEAGDCGVQLVCKLDGQLRQRPFKAGAAGWQKVLVNMLLQADDVLLVATSHEQLQRLLTALHRACNRWQLVINVSKTKHLVVQPPGTQPVAAEVLMLGEEPVERVRQLEYLGIQLSDTGTLEAELSARLRKAAHKCHTLQPTFSLRSLGLRAKLRIFEGTVMPTLLYGAHSWALTAQQEQRLQTFHMRCLRRILGLSLLDRIPNSVILAHCGQQPIKEQLRLQRLLWLGHLVRMPDTRLPKLAFFSQLAEKRPRGRPIVRLREEQAAGGCA